MRINKSEKEIYKTSDLALATIISLYEPILKIDRTTPQRVVFIFKKTSDLEKLVNRYWQKQLTIEVQTFFQQLKLIKTRLYSER